MTISAVSGTPPPPGFRLIDGLLVDEIIAQLNATIVAVNAGGGSGSYTNLTVTGNSALGDAVTDTIGLYGVTPVVQPAAAAQGAVSATAITPLATTAVTQTTPWGFATQAQGDAIATQVNLIITQGAALVALANAIRTAMVALGSMKGAA
jgi:hypothetical protein